MRKRADINQSEIVRFLQSVGASVHLLSDVGDGCPDLLVGLRNENYLLEIKQKIGGKLTPAQENWHKAWRGKAKVVYCIEDIIMYLGL